MYTGNCPDHVILSCTCVTFKFTNGCELITYMCDSNIYMVIISHTCA